MIEKDKPKRGTQDTVSPRRNAVDNVTRMAPAAARVPTPKGRRMTGADRMPNGDPSSLTLWGSDEDDA